MKLKHGDQKRLAEKAGISKSFLCEIINGNKHCPSSLAVKLGMISEEVLGEQVLCSEWILAGLGLRKGVLDAEGTGEGEEQD